MKIDERFRKCTSAESVPRTTTINAEIAEHAETILDDSNTRGAASSVFSLRPPQPLG
jgi:hypothetical protein